jgi:hypothetical protein
MLFQAIRMVENHDSYHWASGWSAEFASIDGVWGVKIFFEHKRLSNPEFMRNHTFNLQQKASWVGLAPKVHTKFNSTLPDGRAVYGYITECVEYVFMDMILAEEGYTGLDDPELSHEDAVTFEEEFDLHKDTCELLRKLANVGFTVSDLHWANVGMLRGKRVAFDFSGEAYIESVV